MHVDRSASIKSAKSDSEETAYSDTSDSTLQGSSYAESKKNEGKNAQMVDCTVLSNKWSSRPSWASRAASSFRANIEDIGSQASCVGLSVKETFLEGGKRVRKGVKTCAKRSRTALLCVRNAFCATVWCFFSGLWMILCAWSFVYVEFFFATLFSISAALLAFTIAIKEKAPVDPVDLQYATQSRLNLIMSFGIFMLIIVPICVILFELSGRGSSSGWGILFVVEFIIGGIWIFAGIASGAGLSNPEADHKYPAGLQCTYNLSTPTPGLCHQVNTVKALLITELVLTFATFAAVGLAPAFAT